MSEHVSMPFVVGVGASAGGLEAITRLLEQATLQCPFAIVVVQHLAPDYPSIMVDLLSGHTPLKVQPAEDGVRLEAGNVYMIQPQTRLGITEGGRLRCEQWQGHVPSPIDHFFSTMAEVCGAGCASVVLSGTGRDGTEGSAHVKERGGIAVAQRLESARFDGMPAAAIARGCIDLELPPDEILSVLQAHAGQGESDGEPRITLQSLGALFSALRRHANIDFSHYKPDLIVRRIQKRLQELHVTDLREYESRLETDATEAHRLTHELLIGVTAFMRDSEAIEILSTVAIPRLLEIPAESPLRIWVAGCSTGEEAYSIAMLLLVAMEASGRKADFKVFATDVDDKAVECASAGRFSEDALQALPEELRDRYFRTKGDHRVASNELRERLLFSKHNVVSDAPFPRMHLVTCRNLLIYLKPWVQQRVLQSLGNSLEDNGLLWLGSSESLGNLAPQFEVLDRRWKLFAAKPGRPRNTPVLPRQRSRTAPTRPAETGDIAEGLLRGYLPPTIVADETMHLAFRYGDLSGLLQFPEGRISLDLRELLPHQLAVLLSSLFHRLEEGDPDLVLPNLETNWRDSRRRFTLRARRLQSPRGRLVSFMFEGLQESPELAEQTVDLDEHDEQRVTVLERELQASRAALQSTVEELESSNEELQSTNEELIASNEELQSTNEELQSVNEELHTVNAEHAQRLDELLQITEDLDQLLSTLDVGIVFLDTKLCIRRFNRHATEFISVLRQDLGRPLAHLSHKFDYPTLLQDCRRVLDERSRLCREVDVEGRTVRVQLDIFLNDQSETKGLVLSISDMPQAQ